MATPSETTWARVGKSYPRVAGPARIRNQADTGQLAFHAAGTGRRTRGWHAPSKSPNDILHSLFLLRDRSRAAGRNDVFGRAGLTRLVTNIIGSGITPRCQAQDADLRRAVHALWDRWTPECDANGLLDFYGLEAQAVRTMLESGEAFVRMRPRLATDGLSVPLQLQILEPDFVPIEYTAQRGSARIRAGIEFDPVGRRVAYHMYRERPGDPSDMDASQLVRVDAGSVVHLYDPIRAGQLRGIPHAAAVLLRLHDLDKFEDATLLRQQLANMFTGFITPRAGDAANLEVDPITGKGIDRDDNDRASIGLEPGTLQELMPGEDLKFAEPPDPASTYGDFVRQAVMEIAIGMDLPYEVLTGDMRGVNDRTVRVVLNEFRRWVQSRQHLIVVHQLCRRVWSEWFFRAVLAGAVSVPDDYLTTPAAYAKVKWVTQGFPYLNPVQDVASQTAAVRGGLKSRSDVITENGDDPEEVDAEIAADNARADKLELIFDSDPRRVQKTGAPAAQPTAAQPTAEAGAGDGGAE